MQTYQLANDRDAYAHHSMWWLVVSDDLEDELAGPFQTEADALRWIAANQKPATRSEER